MGWWDQMWRTKAQDWVYGWLTPEQTVNGTSAELQPDACYLSVFLKSARIVNLRKGLQTFYGVVHSFMRVPHRSLQTAEFNVVTAPGKLKAVDARGLDCVIQLNQRLLGPIPYIAGDIEMEVGLFSVASSNLAAPYLAILETLSKTAGVSFISGALPFAPVILEGVRLLSGNGNDTTLEIGLSTTETNPKQGYFVTMRAPKGAVQLQDLKLDSSDFRLLDRTGSPIADYPYMVFELRGEPERPDWSKIPELAKAYANIQSMYRDDSPDTNSAVQIFRRIAETCNDLTLQDARRLAAKVASMYQTESTRGSSRGAHGKTARELPDLSQMNLYGS